MEWSECPIGSVVEAAADSVRPAAAQRQIAITIKEAGDGVVECDPARLQQAIVNVLANAVKFTPQGGAIQIQTLSDASRARIIVTDTGVGISSEFLPFVFDPFRQADGSSTRQFGGLGLGLSITRKIVEMHGGTIQVSSPGIHKGTTFTIDLPRREAFRRLG
jgi:signal transduction histidine kinase